MSGTLTPSSCLPYSPVTPFFIYITLLSPYKSLRYNGVAEILLLLSLLLLLLLLLLLFIFLVIILVRMQLTLKILSSVS